jgi:hypothetical protein
MKNTNLRPRPVVGQTLFSLNTGNNARNVEQRLTEVKVLKVGREYFTVGVDPSENWMHTRHRLGDWKQDEKNGYSDYAELYSTPEEWEEKKEANIHTQTIRATFDSWTGIKLPLSTLRQIVALIKANLPNEST